MTQVVTAADELQRCCVLVAGERCGQATGFRIASTDGALDDYTCSCGDHVHLVLGPGYRLARIA